MRARLAVPWAALRVLTLAGCKAEVPPAPADEGEGRTSPDAAVTSSREDAGASDHPAPDAISPDTRRGKLDMRPYSAPAPDAFFGESRCPAGVMLCEDFEGNALDPAKWTSELQAGMIALDGMDHARGAGSLAAILTSGTYPDGTPGNRAFIRTVQSFPSKAGG